MPAYDQRDILIDDGLDKRLESLDEVGFLPSEDGVEDGAVLLAELAVGGAAGGERRQLRPQRGHRLGSGGGSRRRHEGGRERRFPDLLLLHYIRVFALNVLNSLSPYPKSFGLSQFFLQVDVIL